METNTTALKAFCIKVITGYQYLISPWLGPCCRFYPSCSEYAKTAIQHRGVFIGGWLILKRIVRCQPLSKGGWDPVPMVRDKK